MIFLCDGVAVGRAKPQYRVGIAVVRLVEIVRRLGCRRHAFKIGVAATHAHRGQNGAGTATLACCFPCVHMCLTSAGRSPGEEAAHAALDARWLWDGRGNLVEGCDVMVPLLFSCGVV